MKINFDLLNQKQNVDKTTTSKETPTANKVNRTGVFAVDISGTVMDNKAYGDHGRTTEDVMQAADSQFDVSLQRNYLTVMSNSMSAEDFNKMLDQGFDPADMEADKVVTIVDHIKTSLAQSGQIIAGYNDDLTSEKLTEITGDESYAQKIESIMQQLDVPATDKNIKNVIEAIDKVSSFESLSDSSIKYMVDNNLEPTIENIYLSNYSVSGDGSKQSKGYYAQELPGYFAKKADNIDLQQLTPQIKKAITQMNISGIEQKNLLRDAEWLITKGIAVTEESIKNLHKIRQISFPLSVEQLAESSIMAISEGKDATDGNLVPGYENIYLKAAKIKERTDSITDQAIKFVVEENKDLTLKNLFEVNNMQILNKNDVRINSSDTVFITAKRQLEEVRLQMTIDANTNLLKKGYSIDTTQLSQLVEDLKRQETELKSKFFGKEEETVLNEKAALYQRTNTVLEELPYLPAAVIGRMSVYEGTVNLSYLYQTGSDMKAVYEAAEKTYEALMTSPRKDMGDSIQKAFQNVDDILNDLNIDITMDNQRAVRILAYNSMDINKEAIYKVKNADKQVDNIIKTITPAKTLQLIRDGNNPLIMNLSELEDELRNLEMQPQEEIEKYSKYLYKLEQNKEISESERSAYIGVYRLFHQIEKTDGAAVGSLIAQGAEITLGNLLSAVRSKKANIDISVDDSFGVLSHTITNGISISKQIEEGVLEARMAHAVYRDLSPKNLQKIEISDDTTLLEIEQTICNQNTSESTDNYMKDRLNEIRDNISVNDIVIQSLKTYEQPISINQLVAADTLMNSKGSLFTETKKLAKKLDEKNKSNSITDQTETLEEKLISSTKQLTECFTDKENAKDAYHNLNNVMSTILEQAFEEVIDTTIDLKAISLCHKQLSVTSGLCDKENYEIPVIIGDDITSINLSIIHNEDQKGMVRVSFDTEEYGKVTAQFMFDNEKVSAMFISDKKNGLVNLKQVGTRIEEDLINQGKIIKEMNYITSNQESPITFFGSDADINSESVSTKDLYQLAKSFLTAFHTIDIEKENRI